MQFKRFGVSLPDFDNFYLQAKILYGAYSIIKYVVPILYSSCVSAKLLQSCLTLCDPTDSSPPGSSVPGILQARTLEWVAISFSNA